MEYPPPVLSGTMTMIAWDGVRWLTVVAATCGHVKQRDRVQRYGLRRQSLCSICTFVIWNIRFMYSHVSAIQVTGILTMGLQIVETGILMIMNCSLIQSCYLLRYSICQFNVRRRAYEDDCGAEC
jgi:hypothetical protein